MSMKSIKTTQHGRVMVTLSIQQVLRLQKQKTTEPDGISRKAWVKVDRTVCQIVRTDTLRIVAYGMAIKSEKESDDSPEALGRAAKLAFRRAVSQFSQLKDRQELWKAWGV